jgi:hypothetical protein
MLLPGLVPGSKVTYINICDAGYIYKEFEISNLVYFFPSSLLLKPISEVF